MKDQSSATAKTVRGRRHQDSTVDRFLQAEVEMNRAKIEMTEAKMEAIQFCIDNQLDCFSLDVRRFKRLTHVGGQ